MVTKESDYEFINVINAEAFGDVLKRKLSIPKYQRDFSWEDEDIDEFLDDIDDVFYNNEKCHFFGQIVIHNNIKDNERNIIDGQQRITTAALLINNIKNIANEYHDEVSVDMQESIIKERFLDLLANAKVFVKDKKTYNLKSDNPFLQNVLENGKNSSGKNKASKKMKKCNDKVKEYLNNKLQEVEDSFNKNNIEEAYNEILMKKCEVLEKVLDCITEKFIVIYLETNELEKAFVIFETLNARGKKLETSELLKNYLFLRSDDKNRDDTDRAWNEIVNKINQIDMTTFIRHYWNSQKDFVRNEELYHSLVKEIKTYDDVKYFLKSLQNNAETYAALYYPYSNDCFKLESIKETIENINSLGAKTYYPIVLALKEREYKEKFILEILLSIENYIFRNFTICGKNPNRAEPKFAEIARNIFKSKSIENGYSVEKIKADIENDAVTEAEFEMNFKNKVLKKADACKYVLRKINNYIYIDKVKHGNDSGEEVFNILKKATKNIHLEHILPQEPEKWIAAKVVTTEQADEYLWRLGNLTLLGKEFNEMIQNDLYEDKKKKGYKKSDIHLNEYFNEINKWDVEEITIRQIYLYENYAKKIWRLEGLKDYTQKPKKNKKAKK